MSRSTATKDTNSFDKTSSTKTSTCSSAEATGAMGCLGGKNLKPKSCLKVRTQCDSLLRTSPIELQTTQAATQASKVTVRFDAVEFREYQRELSDNPAFSGPPIGIGWSYDPNENIMVDLEQYECEREGWRRTRRELIIPAPIRVAMLKEAGYSRSEIAIAAKTAQKVTRKRMATLKQQRFEPVLEMAERVKCGISHRIFPSSH